MSNTIAALRARDASPRIRPSTYPEPFASRKAGRVKRPLGDLFDALHHRHSRQDEFIYVLEGNATLMTEAGETPLRPGMVAGFAASGTAHHLENHTDRDCLILEVGDRNHSDKVSYPADDLRAEQGADGIRRYTHLDGTPY